MYILYYYVFYYVKLQLVVLNIPSTENKLMVDDWYMYHISQNRTILMRSYEHKNIGYM